jgi:hypothetical protein
MRQLTPAQIAADQVRGRAIMAQHIIRTIIGYSKGVAMTKQSSFSRAVDASHAKSSPVYTGHAGEGGLQQHSVGGLYPYHPVAYGNGKWAVHNLVSGKRTAAVLDDYSCAAEWAERFKLSPSEMDEFNVLTKGQR